MVYSAELKSYNVISRGKKFYLQRFGQKQFLHEPNHPYLLPPHPPQKVKCLTYKAFAVNCS